MTMKNREYIQKEFKKLDVDNSGAITAAEFKKLLKRSDIPVGDVDVDEIISLLDVDGDGKV